MRSSPSPSFAAFAALTALLTVVALSGGAVRPVAAQGGGGECLYTLCESIPQHFALNTTGSPSVPTHVAWLSLINGASKTLDIASFYWTLTGGDPNLGGAIGQSVYDALVTALSRGVAVRIAQSAPSEESPDTETQQLRALGAQVVSLNFTEWLGAGILHTKFMLADGQDLYLGSANMDWRSLTQVKEMGIRIRGCTGPLASDLEKLFQIYWMVAGANSLPPSPASYPVSVWTTINYTNPAYFCAAPGTVVSHDLADALVTEFDEALKLANRQQPLQGEAEAKDSCGNAYLASSPPELCAVGRTGDGDAIIDAINNAQSAIDIEIMDYAPAFLYASKPTYWAPLDTALRSAAFDRNVSIRFLAAHWNHTIPQAQAFYESLQDLCVQNTCAGSIQIRWFRIPDDPSGVSPYTRVNHAKYLLTDSQTYITTSNWSADYFVSTGGVSGTFNHPAILAAAKQLFERDWNSPFAVPLSA